MKCKENDSIIGVRRRKWSCKVEDVIYYDGKDKCFFFEFKD